MAKKTRLSEDQIRAILAEQAAGAAVGDIAKKHGISSASFYNWKAKFGGSSPKPKRGRPKGSVQRVVRVAKTATATAPAATLHDENQRLKVMLVNLMLERDLLQARLAAR
jgi:transposase-like protein